MREPWLFWGSLPFLPVAGICFLLALRATSQRVALAFEITALVMAGAAATIMGCEIGFRTASKSIPVLQINRAVGLLFLTGGLLSLATAVAKAFNK